MPRQFSAWNTGRQEKEDRFFLFSIWSSWCFEPEFYSSTITSCRTWNLAVPLDLKRPAAPKNHQSTGAAKMHMVLSRRNQRT